MSVLFLRKICISTKQAGIKRIVYIDKLRYKQVLKINCESKVVLRALPLMNTKPLIAKSSTFQTKR